MLALFRREIIFWCNCVSLKLIRVKRVPCSPNEVIYLLTCVLMFYFVWRVFYVLLVLFASTSDRIYHSLTFLLNLILFSIELGSVQTGDLPVASDSNLTYFISYPLLITGFYLTCKGCKYVSFWFNSMWVCWQFKLSPELNELHWSLIIGRITLLILATQETCCVGKSYRDLKPGPLVS
jgi:hypothetical protein